MVARPAAAIFTVTPVSPPGPGVRMLHGEIGPQGTAIANWTVHDRPRRKGVIEFGGYAPRILTVEAALSYADIEQSIELLLIEVERVLLWPVGELREPPSLRIQGPGVPPFIQMHTWVCTALTPKGDTEERNEDGTRNLAFFTLEFLEDSRATLVVNTRQSPAQAATERAQEGSGTPAPGAPPPASSRTYTVKAGDTLSAIAARELGSAARWKEIADLNGIKDPRQLKVGQLLRLP